jgi:dTDP-4-dehydrorhamnose 3,5-epimerase
MKIEPTAIHDVATIEPKVFGDTRGWFVESWNQGKLAALGLDIRFVQDNHSLSVQAGTVRGLHYQAPPQAQDKLVRCTRGAIWDVAVDIRRGSPTYGNWVGVELTAENHVQLFIPKGFLHGFVTLRPMTEVQYKCSAPYALDCDGGIRWNDPDLAVDWPFDGLAATLSEKDANAPLFRDFLSPFDYGV